MKLFKLHMSMHLITPICDACDKRARHALKFNSYGDKVYMCEDHYNELIAEVNRFSPKAIEPTEPAQAEGR